MGRRQTGRLVWMLRQIFRSVMCGNRKSKRGDKQGKRQNKRNQPGSTRVRTQGDGSFTHTDSAERQKMFQLRRAGLSTHAVAKRLGRSSRTVHQVLTDYGKQAMPEPGIGAGDVMPEGNRDERHRSRRRRHRQGSGEDRGQGDFSSSFMGRVQPQLIEAASIT